ncbi:MAG: Crp/Fnr family transcriptional regulator [Bacteroidota bacterium]
MIDFEKLRAVYQLGRELSFSDIQVVLRSARLRSFERGDCLIREGERRKEVFLIRKGLVRLYRITDRGDEITTAVRWENKVVASPYLILFDQPAQQYFEALEPTDTFCIDYDKLQSIVESHPKLEASRKYVFHNILKEALQRIDSFVLLTPEERYLNFVQSVPDITNRVPDKYLANILGITPVSLSRIRKRIAERKK